MDHVKLLKEAKAKAEAAKTAAADGNMEDHAALMVEAQNLKQRAEAVKAASEFAAEFAEPVMPAQLPQEPVSETVAQAPQSQKAAATVSNEELGKAVRALRFGQESDDPAGVVMKAIYGGDYRQALYDQEIAFGRYVRLGQGHPILNRQFWLPADVKSMLQSGMTVAEIKQTMKDAHEEMFYGHNAYDQKALMGEGQDTLGGYAVPPQVGADILKRNRGMTAIRGGGARVVQTVSGRIEWLKVTGGNDQYTGAIRGAWGSEGQSPSEKNMTFGLLPVDVKLYTYKVRMTTSMLEDASNITTIFNEEVADAVSIDEDIAFITGDGNTQPLGILPNNTNFHSLTEVVTGAASELTVTGVKALRRGVASQYRMANRSSWIGNSATGSVIENFQDGMGRFYFDMLDDQERFMRSAWRESEAMADIAASAYPLLFGDLSAYVIVERLGFIVRRYNDSNTGINRVEFHVRRRIGGSVAQPYKLAVQKVAAS